MALEGERVQDVGIDRGAEEARPAALTPAEILTQLIPSEGARLLRVVRRALGAGGRRRTDPEDVVQEVWARAFARLDQLETRDPSGVRSWLTQIARNCSLDALRRHQSACTTTAAEPVLTRPSIDHEPRAREAHESRTCALGRLAPEERMVVWLRAQGLCWETVRLVMGKPTIRVARRVYARARVRVPILESLY